MTPPNVPDHTAVRTALWRALHLQEDADPPVFEDPVGLQLVQPPAGWQQNPDMKFTRRIRAAIVARARFVEDQVKVAVQNGMTQYIILGSGLDTFALRHPELSDRLRIFEIDQPATLTWKQERMQALGYDLPASLSFVPVDFENEAWWEKLSNHGFEPAASAFLACTGLSLYLTKGAIRRILTRFAAFSSGSQLAMDFYLPVSELEEADKEGMRRSINGARESGTPFKTLGTPEPIRQMAAEAGLKSIQIVTTEALRRLYFDQRTDSLTPASGIFFLLAKS